jgi:hypothetical protein
MDAHASRHARGNAPREGDRMAGRFERFAHSYDDEADDACLARALDDGLWTFGKVVGIEVAMGVGKGEHCM